MSERRGSGRITPRSRRCVASEGVSTRALSSLLDQGLLRSVYLQGPQSLFLLPLVFQRLQYRSACLACGSDLGFHRSFSVSSLSSSYSTSPALLSSNLQLSFDGCYLRTIAYLPSKPRPSLDGCWYSTASFPPFDRPASYTLLLSGIAWTALAFTDGMMIPSSTSPLLSSGPAVWLWVFSHLRFIPRG